MSDSSILASARQAVVANPYLADPEELHRIWNENGYLYFQGVVEPDRVRGIRDEYAKALHALGLIDDPSGPPIWNGNSLDCLDHAKLPQIASTGSWRQLTSSVAVNDILRVVLRDDPIWLPMTEYRAVPPSSGEVRFLGIHQDAYQNSGMSFLGVWIPLDDIDESMGGLVLAEGWHKRGFIHDDHSQQLPLVAPTAIDPHAWRRSHYRPGDMVVFCDMIPHAGVSNQSDRFRLSMDLRVTGASCPLPVIGTLIAAPAGRIVIRTAEDRDVSLVVNAQTRLRLAHGVQVAPENVEAEMVGLPVIASCDQGTAITVRSAVGA